MQVNSNRIQAESKYALLWAYIMSCAQNDMKLSFEEIRKIAGVQIDHSFLNYKKELEAYGYRVGKISMKESSVSFERLGVE